MTHKCNLYYSIVTALSLYESESPFFSVAMKASRLEAFCVAYDQDFVERLKVEEPWLCNYAFFNYLVKLNHFQKKYLFCDLIAARDPESMTGKIAVTKLSKTLLSKARKHIIPSVIGAILHAPLNNKPSVAFAEKQGAKLIDMLHIDNGSIKIGMYELTL